MMAEKSESPTKWAQKPHRLAVYHTISGLYYAVSGLDYKISWLHYAVSGLDYSISGLYYTFLELYYTISGLERTSGVGNDGREDREPNDQLQTGFVVRV
ncbi:hypothetical protein T484DRAFT_1982696 [Baffinella frigidus]|nr:hypothetical protein T484DRAFT_1982696 [Cryptophyta sp. CCMP2293]